MKTNTSKDSYKKRNIIGFLLSVWFAFFSRVTTLQKLTHSEQKFMNMCFGLF